MSSDIDWQWQKLRLQIALSNLDGDGFETEFQTIAKAAWKVDFTPTIPMGSRGDLKCDGHRSSTKTIFQCYGPRYGQTNVSEAVKKVNEDFPAAVAHWKSEMKRWVFAVNLYRDKVPSEVILAVEAQSTALGVPAEIWTREEIDGLAAIIDPEMRFQKWGRAPIPADMVRVTYEFIGKALALVKRKDSDDALAPVPLPPSISDKIDHNALSESVRALLAVGQTGAERVRQYLMNQVDPLESEHMAQGFVKRYRDCRNQGMVPDTTFGQMVIFAGGATSAPDNDCAALAIVSHFFSTCEIFERPPEKAAA